MNPQSPIVTELPGVTFHGRPVIQVDGFFLSRSLKLMPGQDDGWTTDLMQCYRYDGFVWLREHMTREAWEYFAPAREARAKITYSDETPVVLGEDIIPVDHSETMDAVQADASALKV